MLRKPRNLILLLAVVLGLSGRALASSTVTVTVGGAETVLSSGNWDSGKITLWLSDTNNGIYIETIPYGQFSTPASLASAFAAAFSNSYVSAGLCAHASGNSITFYLKGTAILQQPSVVNSSASFSFNPSNSNPPPPAQPFIAVCSDQVDPNYNVEEMACLSGDASSLDANSSIYNDDGSGYVAGVEVQESVGINNQTYSTDTSQSPSSASVDYQFVPQTNAYYTLTSSYGECLDQTRSDDYNNCSWQIDISGQNQGDVTQVPPPTITSVSPTSGAVGTSVTIIGTNFGTSLDNTNVTFRGTVATSITSWSPTSMVVVVPTGATTGNLVVTVSGWTSNAVEFTVPGTTPVVTGVTPSSGNVGVPVTISGYGFGAAEGQGTVTFNGVQGGVLNWSDTSITAVVPNNATTGPVVVTLDDGEPSNNNFSFTANASSCN